MEQSPYSKCVLAIILQNYLLTSSRVEICTPSPSAAICYSLWSWQGCTYCPIWRGRSASEGDPTRDNCCTYSSRRTKIQGRCCDRRHCCSSQGHEGRRSTDKRWNARNTSRSGQRARHASQGKNSSHLAICQTNHSLFSSLRRIRKAKRNLWPNYNRNWSH